MSEEEGMRVLLATYPGAAPKSVDLESAQLYRKKVLPVWEFWSDSKVRQKFPSIYERAVGWDMGWGCCWSAFGARWSHGWRSRDPGVLGQGWPRASSV